VTVDPWSVVVTAGGLATLAVGVWMALRSADARAARDAALQGRIDSARSELPNCARATTAAPSLTTSSPPSRSD
jgi:hypothetical protein